MAPNPTTRLTEVEWQFDAPSLDEVEAWLGVGVPGFVVTPRAARDLVDEYFDTEDWRIHRAGYTCRYRRSTDGGELTLKSMAAADDTIRTRQEITEHVAGGDGALRGATGEAGNAIRAVAGDRPLRRLFTVRTHRRRFRLADAIGEFGEVALDATTIEGPDGTPVTLSRVEVEVSEDAVGRTRIFVSRLVEDCGLGPAGSSKFGLGLAAHGLQPSGLPEVGSSDIGPGQSVAEVAYAVLRRHFRVLLREEPGTRLGEDPESLHDMRVATRRLRSALSIFKPYLPEALAAEEAHIAEVSRVLGPVRDLDVQIERIGLWRGGLAEPEAKALGSLEQHLRHERDLAREAMIAALDRPEHGQLIERLTVALRSGPPADGPAGASAPILAVAPSLVRRRLRRLRRHGDAIDHTSSMADYHRLRIDGKKLRYVLEALADVYGRPVQVFTKRLVALQDQLGLMHDAEVAVAQLRALAAKREDPLPRETLLAMGAVIERYAAEEEELRHTFPVLYARLSGRRRRRLEAALDDRRAR